MARKQYLLAAALIAGAGLAQAQTPPPGSITITANVQAACTIASTSLAFGAYNPLGTAATEGSASLEVACVTGSAPRIALNTGGNANGAQRRMASSGNYLNYNLYQPSSTAPGAPCTTLNTPWGEGATAMTVAAATSLAPRTFNVCGAIPAGQNVPAGSYQDVVQASVSF